MKSIDKRKIPHWYYMHYGECSVCGSDQTYKEYKLGIGPTDPSKQGEVQSIKDSYCGCMSN